MTAFVHSHTVPSPLGQKHAQLAELSRCFALLPAARMLHSCRKGAAKTEEGGVGASVYLCACVCVLLFSEWLFALKSVTHAFGVLTRRLPS